MTELIFWCYIFCSWYLHSHVIFIQHFLETWVPRPRWLKNSWKEQTVTFFENLRFKMNFWNFWCGSFERVRIWEPKCVISSLLRWCPKSDQCSSVALHCSSMVPPWNRNGDTWFLGREVLIQQIKDFNGSQRQLVPDAGVPYKPAALLKFYP